MFFSFCRDSCRGNRNYLLLSDHTADKEPRRGGGGFKLCVLPGAHLTQLSENVTPIVSGAVFIRAIIDIGTSIFGPFLRKDHEPVHFCHANYILISDRGTSPKVF